jgi:hypothetical protein
MSSPQYAEALLDRWWGPTYLGGHPRPDYLIEAEVRAMDEGLAKRREWSRARGYLAAAFAPVAATVVKAAKRVAKPKPVIPAAVTETLESMRTTVEWIEPYPATLGEASQYPEEVLAMWEQAETLYDLFQQLDSALDALIEA